MRILLSILTLLFWGLLLCFGLAICALHSERAAAELGRRLSVPEAGVKVSVEGLGLTFFPQPGLRLDGLLVRLAPGKTPGDRGLFPQGLSLYAEACELRPDWLALLGGKKRLSLLRLTRPVAVANMEVGQAAPLPALAAPGAASVHGSLASAPAAADFREVFANLEVSIRDGSLELRQGSILRLSGLDGSIRLPAFEALPPDSERRSRAALNLAVREVDWKKNPAATGLSLRKIHVDLDDLWFRGPQGAGANSSPGANLGQTAGKTLGGSPKNTAPGKEPSGQFALLLASLLRADLRLSLDLASLLPPDSKALAVKENCRLTCSARLGTSAQGSTLEGEIALNGSLPIKGHPTPANVRIPFTLEPTPADPTAALSGALTGALANALGPTERPDKVMANVMGDVMDGPSAAHTPEKNRARDGHMPVVRINDASFKLDNDVAAFSGRLLPGRALAFLPAFHGASEEARLEGRLDVERLSLPRWFGFARLLPDGVRAALDKMTGRLTLSLTPTTLTVSRLEARLLGMSFSGTGSVPDLGKPVIVINARTEKAEINAVLPELAGRQTKGPVYAMPPAVDIDVDEPRMPDDVGYDIRLGADQAEFWKLGGRGFTFRVSPSQDGVRLDFGLAAFYKGSLEAALILEKDARLSASLHDVDAEEPITRIAGAPLFGGRVNAKADLLRQGGLGDSVPDFAADLQGALEAQAKNGFWTDHGGETPQRLTFGSAVFAFQGQGKGGGPFAKMPDSLPYTGIWRLDMSTRDWQASGRLDGTAELSTKTWLPVRAENAPTRLSASVSGFQVSSAGKLSFSKAEHSFTFSEVSGDLRPTDSPSALPASVSGEVSYTVGKEKTGRSLSGRLAFNAPALRPLLSRLLSTESLASLPQDSLRRLNLACKFFASEQECRLSGIDGKLDTTSFGGNLSRTAGGRPRWHVDARVGELNVNRYLPTASRKGKSNAHSPAFTRFLEDLKSFDLSGRLQAEQLGFFHILLEQADLPLSLEKGVFSSDPITAKIFGGKMDAALNANILSPALSGPAIPGPATPSSALPGTGARSGANISLRYNANNIAMLAMSKARKMDNPIAGVGSFQGDVHGFLRSPGDIPGAFSGKWAFAVRNGAFLSATAKPEAQGTSFSILQGTGLMTNGVLSNDDLRLVGNNLSATGHGRIDLVNQTLNYDLNVSVIGVPNIPIHYYGSLDDPKRNVGALQAVTGALGNLGSGVFNLLEGAVTAPLRLLRP